MDTIFYMWNFKPNERSKMHQDVIRSNSIFIKKYSIVTPETIKPLITNDIFTNLVELYNLIPHWIVKADLGRLLVIYFNGGMYSDADCFIKKQFDKHNMVLFTEHICTSIQELGTREDKHPDNLTRVANYCFGSKTPRHPFIKEVVLECLRRLNQLLVVENLKDLNSSHILWVCGPDVITTVYHKLKHEHDIFLFDQSYLIHKRHGSWR